MSATCLSWAICNAACDCCFGWIRFCYWAGRGEGSDDCNVLNHVQSSAGLQQACLRFETRFFVWREVVQAVFCHRCHSSCQTLKDRGAWTLLDSNSPCPHSAAYHNIARWGEGGATWASASKPAGTASMTDVQVLSMLFCFGFENGAAKQQLQKWELKFVTELEPLEGASPVCLFGEKTGLLWKNVWLPGCSETLKGWMARFYFECGSRSFRFNVYLEIRKNRFKISSHFGSRKATPKMGVGAVVIAKVNEAYSDPPFWG